MIELHQWPCHLFPSNEDYYHLTMTPNDPEKIVLYNIH